MTSLYGPVADCKSQCWPAAPNFGGCGPVCCAPAVCCGIEHPPKTSARDAFFMPLREIARTFRLAELGCRGAQLNLNSARLSLNLRRKGRCTVLVCVPPLSLTLDGHVTFHWPEEFLSADPGQYEADVFVDGCEVASVLLVKPDKYAVITSTDVTECETSGCADECTSDCGGGGCGISGCATCGCDEPTCSEFAEVDGSTAELTDDSCGECQSC